MKETENYRFPYPECDPPLVKDASQIVQFGALAESLDTEVQRIINQTTLDLTGLPAARLITAAVVATTDAQVTPVFDTIVFQQNWGGFLPLSGGMGIGHDAWYMVGAHAATDSAVAMQVNVRLTVNGQAATSWSNPGSPYSTIFQLPALGMGPLQLLEGDILNMELKHNAAGGTAWNYRPHLWAVKLVTV